MLKRSIKIMSVATLISFLVMVVSLPFATNSGLNLLWDFAQAQSDPNLFTQSTEGVEKLNFTTNRPRSHTRIIPTNGDEIRISVQGINGYKIATTAAVEGSELNIELSYTIHEEFRKAEKLLDTISGQYFVIEVPHNIEVNVSDGSYNVQGVSSSGFDSDSFSDYLGTEFPSSLEDEYRSAVGQFMVGNIDTTELTLRLENYDLSAMNLLYTHIDDMVSSYDFAEDDYNDYEDSIELLYTAASDYLAAKSDYVVVAAAQWVVTKAEENSDAYYYADSGAVYKKAAEMLAGQNDLRPRKLSAERTMLEKRSELERQVRALRSQGLSIDGIYEVLGI